MGETPVLKLIGQMSAPSVVSMLVIAAYNMVDTIFVGRYVGSEGLAALASNIPVIVLMMGFSLFVGVGGSTVISRSLGAGNHAKAHVVFGTMMFMVIVLSAANYIVYATGTEWLLRLLGTSEAHLEPAAEYLEILLLGGPLSIFSVVMNNLVRSEGNARTAMVSMVTGALVNVALDPLFIHTLGWGIRGAAWATVVANGVTTAIMIGYLMAGRSSLVLRPGNIRFNALLTREISGVGMSTFLMHSSASIIQSLVIRKLVEYGGESTVSVYAMCNRTMMFLFMPIFGVQAGVLPIIGYNFGAKLMARVRYAVFASIGLCTAYLVVAWAFMQLMPETILRVYTSDTVLLAEGVNAIKKLTLAFPVVGAAVMVVGTFQAIGKAKYALFLTVNRTFILVIPLLVWLPPHWGTDGVWLTFPISDGLGMVVNGIFFWKVYKNFRD